MSTVFLYINFDLGPHGVLLAKNNILYPGKGLHPALVAALPPGARIGVDGARRIYAVHRSLDRLLSPEEVAAILDPTPPRCGDQVIHIPTGQTWLVAYSGFDILAPAGWPDTRAKLSECAVIKRADEASHRAAVKEWLKPSDDSRRERVLCLYGAALVLDELERLDRADAAAQAEG